MTRTTDTSINQHYNIRSLALTLLLGALSVTAMAAPDVVRGVRNSAGPHRLNPTQLQQVQASLRQKSGLMELGFDEQGALTPGNRLHLQGGSATARALLIAAVESANLYELESHESSPEVAFARILESEDRMIGETGQRINIYQVQLDFADFNRLGGAREAKAAFDIGIALLHELVHGVLKLQDPQGGMDQIGDCDAHVNQMRRELHLPERLYYHPGITVVQLNGGRIVSARLQFAERQSGATLPGATYELTWLPGQVSPKARNIAQLEQGLAITKRR